MDTDPGRKRKQNQDAIGQLIPTDSEVLARLGQLFVLADGVGGLYGGDLASQYAVSTVLSSYYEQEEGDPPERLARAIAEANNVIYAEGQGQDVPTTMATTVVAAIIRGRDLIIGSVGDSPAYLMRDANARKLTLDHTLEEMQREAGVPIDPGNPMGRKLVRALGSQPSVKVDIISGLVRAGDHIVLCSDGLTRYLNAQEIEGVIAVTPPQRAVKSLIELANERGGADNISVIVLRLAEDENVTYTAVESSLPGQVDEDLTIPADPIIPSANTPVLPSEDEPAPVPMLRRRRAPRGENPITDLWRLFRGRTILTAISMGVILILFVIILLIVINTGDKEGEHLSSPIQSSTPDPAITVTAIAQLTSTVQMAAIQTSNAVEATLAAEQATSAALTLTPAPPSGPQMENRSWFRVLPGDDIPTFEDPDINAAESMPLSADTNYLVQTVNTEHNNGPWYYVVDNMGAEPERWVNGPSLHQRIVVIDESGNPLPNQPPDLAPGSASPTPEPTRTSAPTQDGIPSGDPLTPTPTETPDILYGVEIWTVGSTVTTKDNLDLCSIPSITDCDSLYRAAAGESTRIIGGPTGSEGHWWWQVDFGDGRVGWIAQVLLG
jgi:protein phosphatase